MARRDPNQAAILRDWVDGQIMVDAKVASRAAALHIPDRDAFIAATALVHAMIVVTRNSSDFEPAGVRVLDPWIE